MSVSVVDLCPFSWSCFVSASFSCVCFSHSASASIARRTLRRQRWIVVAFQFSMTQNERSNQSIATSIIASIESLKRHHIFAIDCLGHMDDQILHSIVPLNRHRCTVTCSCYSTASPVIAWNELLNRQRSAA